MDFDLDNLIGMRVKTIWEENGDFQNIESIFPEGAKLQWTPGENVEPYGEIGVVDDGASQDVPF
mgnify:CR=1 FL=1